MIQDTTSILTKIPSPSPQGIADAIYGALLLAVLAWPFHKWIKPLHIKWSQAQEERRISKELNQSRVFVKSVIAGRNRPEVLAWYMNEANTYRFKSLGFLVLGLCLFMLRSFGTFRVSWGNWLFTIPTYICMGYMVASYYMSRYYDTMIQACALATVNESERTVTYEEKIYTDKES